MEDNTNKVIQYNLELFKKQPFYYMKLELYNLDGKRLKDNDSTILFDKLVYENLIKVSDYKKIYLSPYGNEILDNGGWLKQLELKKHKAVKQEAKDEEIKELTSKNLKLQNRQLKRQVFYSVISFSAGAVLTNLKYILDLWKTLTQSEPIQQLLKMF